MGSRPRSLRPTARWGVTPPLERCTHHDAIPGFPDVRTRTVTRHADPDRRALSALQVSSHGASLPPRIRMTAPSACGRVTAALATVAGSSTAAAARMTAMRLLDSGAAAEVVRALADRAGEAPAGPAQRQMLANLAQCTAGWGTGLPATTGFLVDALIERGELDAADAALERAGIGDDLPDTIRCGKAYLVARGRLHLARGRLRPGLAANGLSNREIAKTLFLSRKTIEMHLGRAYASSTSPRGTTSRRRSTGRTPRKSS